MTQNIFIIGANGNVGSTLVKQIFSSGDTNPKLHVNPTKIVGLASINEYLYKPEGISKEECYTFVDKKAGEGSYELDELLKTVEEKPVENLTFIDVTAAKEPMKRFHLKIINDTPYGIVTSNKNPVTMITSQEFFKLASHTNRYGFRCSVMAGANAIDELLDFKDLGDQIVGIEGCFSGTLGYLCSKLQEGKTFSSSVIEAKKEGYTEPHPRDDLSGEDVAKKLLILARTAGIEVDMKDVQRVPFISQEYLDSPNVDNFMSDLSKLDSYFNEIVEQAKKEGKVLRYVASLSINNGVPKLNVGPKLVSELSPLGMLSGTLNKIVIETQTYTKEKPCIIEAPGAGLAVTAQNIRRDLLKQLRERKVSFEK